MNKLYTINQVAEILQITPNTIKFYEKNGLLSGRKGIIHKKYDLNHIITLQSILLYRSIGLSSTRIKILLRKNKNKNFLSIYEEQLKLINTELYKMNTMKNSLELISNELKKENVDTYIDDQKFIDILFKSNMLNNISAKKNIGIKRKDKKLKGTVIKVALLAIVCFSIFQINKVEIVNKIEKYILSNKSIIADKVKNKPTKNQVIKKDKSESDGKQWSITKENINEKNKVEDTIKYNEENKTIDKNSPYLIISNKTNHIGENYVPDDLTIPQVNFREVGNSMVMYMKSEAAKALEELFAEASKSGINLVAVSGYRSYDYQVNVYNNEVYNSGADEASKYVALPGESEHQLGLSMDLLSDEYGSLDEGFENTQAYTWLIENMSRFGFILRYPKGKEDITGYGYEPWHLRYVGIDPATEIMNKHITLEEYMN